ncbi:MAG: hypothetical protein MJZ05_02050 [Fibrobacter sp.]|nr:hypothetical protein [Fibrobacter sp.]
MKKGNECFIGLEFQRLSADPRVGFPADSRSKILKNFCTNSLLADKFLRSWNSETLITADSKPSKPFLLIARFSLKCMSALRYENQIIAAIEGFLNGPLGAAALKALK